MDIVRDTGPCAGEGLQFCEDREDGTFGITELKNKITHVNCTNLRNVEFN